MAGNDFIFYGTTGPTGGSSGASQPDREQWLGRFRAAERLDEVESSLTSNQTARSQHVFVDTARIGDGVDEHALKWIAVQTGAAAQSAARVVSFDNATGVFVLDRRLEGLAQTGDVYRIFAPNNVWPDVTAEQARVGDERFRSIVIRNTHGAITNANLRRLIFRPLDFGGLDFSMTHQVQVVTSPFLQRDDDTTDVVDEVGKPVALGGPFEFDEAPTWVSPFDIAHTYKDIRDTGTWGLNTDCAIWLRRTVPAGITRRRSVAVQIIFISDVTGDDPDPLSGSAIMVFDVDPGLTTGTITPDRYATVLGGSRVGGRVFSGGFPASTRNVRWHLRDGDLGAIFTNDVPLAGFDQSDADGAVDATYVSPTAVGAEGEDIEIRMAIGDGEEVANPKRRLTLSGTAAFGWDTSGELEIPSDEQAFLENQATGFWTGF